MKLGIIAPSHDRNGVKFVADLGLKYAEFDINAPARFVKIVCHGNSISKWNSIGEIFIMRK